MEAGKAYAVWVNQWHQIRNDSDEDRYHIIMDFYDTKKVTKTFNYNGDISQLEEMAAMMRKNIDEAVIPADLYEKFETVRQSFITKGEIPLLK
jgi:3,4-dihydroxy-2-butanone 4-phosphate synthase